MLCLAAELVQEWCVREETILVLLTSQLIKHLDSILLGNHVPQVAQDVLQLGQHHGAVLVLVVELAELDKVMVVTEDLRLLQSLLDEGNDLVKLAELLAIVVSLAVLDADLLDNVEAKGIEDVHKVVHVDDTLHVPIIDLADPLDIIRRL